LHIPYAVSSGKGSAGTHWTGGWVGRGARLDVLEERNVCYPCQELNP